MHTCGSIDKVLLYLGKSFPVPSQMNKFAKQNKSIKLEMTSSTYLNGYFGYPQNGKSPLFFSLQKLLGHCSFTKVLAIKYLFIAP